VASSDISLRFVLATSGPPGPELPTRTSGLPGTRSVRNDRDLLLVYALFGPSRILVLGPDIGTAAVILGVVFRCLVAILCAPQPRAMSAIRFR